MLHSSLRGRSDTTRCREANPKEISPRARPHRSNPENIHEKRRFTARQPCICSTRRTRPRGTQSSPARQGSRESTLRWAQIDLAGEYSSGDPPKPLHGRLESRARQYRWLKSRLAPRPTCSPPSTNRRSASVTGPWDKWLFEGADQIDRTCGDVIDACLVGQTDPQA